MAELRRENEMLNAQMQELEAKPQGDAPATRATVPVVPFDDIVHDLFERPLWLSQESSLMREFDRAFNDMGLFPWDLRRPFAQGAFSMAGPLTSLKEMESEVNKVQSATEKQLAESMGEEVKCEHPTQQSYATVDIDGVKSKSVSMRCKAKAVKSGKECDVQVRGTVNDDNTVDLDALFLDGSKLIGPADSEQKQVSDEPAQATG